MLSIAIGAKRIALPFTAQDGSKPLVVATPNEYVSEVIKRVEAVGGSANVALAEARKFTIFIIEGEANDAPMDDRQDVSDDMSMGMFWLKAKVKRSSQFRIRNAEAKFPATKQEFAYSN